MPWRKRLWQKNQIAITRSKNRLRRRYRLLALIIAFLLASLFLSGFMADAGFADDGGGRNTPEFEVRIHKTAQVVEGGVVSYRQVF